MTKLNSIPIIVEKHQTLNIKKGVFHCEYLQGMSDVDICSELQEQNVIEVYRVQKREGANKVPTDTFIVTFETTTLPKEVKVGYYNIKVQLYIPNPRRCFNCQKFGHGQNTCRHPAICAKCGQTDEHSYEECPADELKCANCTQSHSASSKACPMWKLEKQILEHKFKNDVTFKDAKAHIYATNPQLVSVIPSLENVRKSTQTWSNVTAAPSALQQHQQLQYQTDIFELKNQVKDLTEMFQNFMRMIQGPSSQIQNTPEPNIQENSHQDIPENMETQNSQDNKGQKRSPDDSSSENEEINPQKCPKQDTNPSGKEGSTSLASSSNGVESTSAAPENSIAVQKGNVDEEGFRKPLRHSRPRGRDGGSSPQRSRSRSSMRRNKYDPLSDEDNGSTDKPGNAPPNRPPRLKKEERTRLGSHSSSDSDKSSTSNKSKYVLITGP